MALTYPFDVNNDLGANASHIQSNFAAVQARFNQGITAADLSPTIVIPSANLSANKVEDIVQFSYQGTLSASTTVPLQTIRLPGTGAYTLANASYTYRIVTIGGTAGSVGIQTGTFSGGNWVTSSTLVSSTSLSTVTPVNFQTGGDFALSTTSFTAPQYIGLLATATGTTTVYQINITLRLTRTLQ